jgi:hypothetical protein
MDTANPRKLSNILQLSASELAHTLGTMMTTRKARNYATNTSLMVKQRLSLFGNASTISRI